MNKRVLTSVALLAGVGGASGQLVDLDFTTEAVGSVTSVVNGGTMGGVFENFGGGANDPQITQARSFPASFPGTPGTAGLELDGSDFLTHLQGPGGAFQHADAGIVGLDRTSSVEVWVLNPAAADEETVVAWGKRGGPAASNASHNFGHHGTFGAIGHWGPTDIGWVDAANTAGGPSVGEWHHLAYTYDGTTTRVYVDGALANSEVVGAGVMNTHGGTPITVGSQMDGNWSDATPNFTAGLRGTLTVGALQVFDEVRSDSDILASYNARSGDFTQPVAPAAPVASELRAGPTNRWTFDIGDVVGDGSDGTVVRDVVGGADGTVRGAGAGVAAGVVSLPGGSGASQAYVDLPNGLVSTHGSGNGGSGAVTLEFWATVTGAQNWSRVFDFGSSDSAEVMGPGGGGQGTDYLMVSAQIGGDTAFRRIELRNEDPPGGGISTTNTPTGTFGNEFHGVLTLDEATGEYIYYENGEFMNFGSMPAGWSLADLNDVNNWLGRSNWTADANMQGSFNEFRIYDYALDRDEVLGNFGRGPNVVIPEPAALVLLGLSGLALIFRRRKR